MKFHAIFIAEGPVDDRVARLEMVHHPSGTMTLDELAAELEEWSGKISIFTGPVCAAVEMTACDGEEVTEEPAL